MDHSEKESEKGVWHPPKRVLKKESEQLPEKLPKIPWNYEKIGWLG